MLKVITLLICLLAVRVVLFNLYPPKQTKPAENLQLFTSVTEHIKHAYSEFLPSQDSGLLMGIVFGDKSLPKDAMSKFQDAGVVHIIAASGMNVSMLTAFVLGTLLLFMRRQYALVATIVIIVFYTGLGQFQPSIVRAAIMGVVALGAGLFGRQNTSLLALLFAAYLMVLWDPSVVTSISFMLSFSATAGILFLDPLFKKVGLRAGYTEDLRTTLCAQIATTPILLYYFGTYQTASIVTNLLVLWTVPPLMVLGTIAAVLSFISPILAAPFIYLCLPLLTYFFIVIDFMVKVAKPVDLKEIPLTIVIGYYFILVAIVIFFNRKKDNVSQAIQV